MYKPDAHPGLVPSPRFPTLLGASIFALLGPWASGCDAPRDSEHAQSPVHESNLSQDAAAYQAQSNGVRVRVAGQLQCSTCSVADLETLLGATPRKPLPKDPLVLPPELETDGYSQQHNYRWTVKFRDSLEVRLTSQQPLASKLLASKVPREQTPNPGLPQLYSRRGGAELNAVEDLRQRYQARFVPELDATEDELDDLRERALRRSLIAQPDLAALYWVDATFESPEQMLRFGEELQALPEVEFVHLQPLNVPPPQDIPPKTTDFSDRQGYLGPDPGVDGMYAWKQGYFGEGVRISDCEYGWETEHEDLSENPLQVEKGQSPRGHEIEHGTAVMGIVVAGHNGYGVKGLAPKAKPAVYPEGPNRRTASVTNAIKDSKKGDIVMLEMQTYGRSQKQLVPAEYDKPVWMATKTGTDAGVLVIAAAGNGYESLDIDFYKKYLDRGDSGAIIVGAGTSNRSHNKMDFSTYGKRVDVHAWGQNVVTTGYGDLKKFGGDKRQTYTRQFAGTSSATPIVSGAAALIQSFVKKEHGRDLSPKEMRTLLKETGVAQGSGGKIGPMPNVKAAFEKLGKGEADKEEPTAKITKPEKDIEVTLEEDQSSHTFKVEVEAKDNKAVKSVHLEVDGKKVGDADKEEPYIFDIELEEGSYKIVAVATDSSDNEGRSKALNAKVSPFEEEDESESESGSESESDSDPDPDSETDSDSNSNSDSESGESESNGDESESETDSDSDSDSEGETETDEPGEEDTGRSNEQDDPDPPKKEGCTMQDSTPLPATMAFGLLILAGLRRHSQRITPSYN